jgi:hypothetical protein
MNQTMKMAVAEFKGISRHNPDEDLKLNFRNYLLAKGILEPKEEDLMEAALAVGIPEDELPEFVEEFGSQL